MSSGSLPLATYHRAGGLGCGTYGSVITVYNDEGEEYALKLFLDEDEDDDEDGDVDEGSQCGGVELGALREISILRLLRGNNGHPNIVPMVDVKVSSAYDDCEEDVGAGIDGCVSMALPLYRGGTLEDAINSGLLKSCDRSHRVRIAHGVLCAVACLHDNGIIHRDIKADNVMLEQASDDGGGGSDDGGGGSWTPVLIDFSLAKIVNGSMYGECGCSLTDGYGDGSESGATHTGEVGTVTYTSPEVVSRKPYGLKSDLWSVGVVLLEMIQNRTLPAAKDKEAARLIEEAKGSLPDQPFANLVRGLLEVDPDKRLSAREALQSKLFRKFGMDVPATKIIDIASALPLEGDDDGVDAEERKENAAPYKHSSNNNRTGGKKQKKLDPKLVRRQRTIRRLCNELDCANPMTSQAAFTYSRQMEQLDDNFDDITKSQILQDCVILASKFFERELLDLSELEEEVGGSFENWTLEEYHDNESTIWMLMDYCLYPRRMVEWDGL